jgi:hypothetical protein
LRTTQLHHINAPVTNSSGGGETEHRRHYLVVLRLPFSIALIQGNPVLHSEEADTLTFGTVLGFDQ